MAVPLALMAVGTAMQIAGQYQANMDQARQELKNAAFYKKQAEFARLSELRAQQIAEFDYTAKIGQQRGDYAASGVDMSGSAAITIGGTIANYINEAFAIKKKGEIDFELARSRGILSEQTGAQLSSTSYNLTQATTSLIKAYGATEGFGMGFPKGTNPTSLPPSNTSGTLKYYPSVTGTPAKGAP